MFDLTFSIYQQRKRGKLPEQMKYCQSILKELSSRKHQVSRTA